MKLKALVIAGLVSLVAASTSMAQTVFSVNAVGFVNKEIPSGFSIIANPLIAEDNHLSALFPTDTFGNGWRVYRFNAAGGDYTLSSSLFGSWTQDFEVLPGEGFFIFNPGAAASVTFVGEVPQGTLETPLPAGFSIVSSQVPQEGLVETELGFPAANGDRVYKFDGASYSLSTYLFGSWTGGEPTIGVAEGFFAFKGAMGVWTREFSTND